jgi:hypothetical protein
MTSHPWCLPKLMTRGWKVEKRDDAVIVGQAQSPQAVSSDAEILEANECQGLSLA